MSVTTPHTTSAVPAASASTDWVRPLRLIIVIVCYRAVDLTIDCLKSLEPEIAANPGVGVIVCENGTGGNAEQTLRHAVHEYGWGQWVEIRAIHPNRGFSGGNNAVLDDILTWSDAPEYVLLLNADTIVRPGAIAALLSAGLISPDTSIFAPLLENPDGTPQVSCFRDFRPLGEILAASKLGFLFRVLPRYVVPGGPANGSSPTDWVSFAAVMIRHSLMREIGVLDAGYFLYFDDPDFCHRARLHGARTLVVPESRFVHLQGQSNPLESLKRAKERKPWYHFRSRSRYYAKYFGRGGLLVANLSWEIGFVVAVLLWLLLRRPLPSGRREWLDIWSGFWRPLAAPDRSQDG